MERRHRGCEFWWSHGDGGHIVSLRDNLVGLEYDMDLQDIMYYYGTIWVGLRRYDSVVGSKTKHS